MARSTEKRQKVGLFQRFFHPCQFFRDFRLFRPFLKEEVDPEDIKPLQHRNTPVAACVGRRRRPCYGRDLVFSQPLVNGCAKRRQIRVAGARERQHQINARAGECRAAHGRLLGPWPVVVRGRDPVDHEANVKNKTDSVKDWLYAVVRERTFEEKGDAC